MEHSEYMRRSLGNTESVPTTFAESGGESQPSSIEQQRNTSAQSQNQELDPAILAPGEIVFVAFLVLIVAIAIGVAIQSLIHRRRKAREEKEEACPSVDDTQDVAMSTVALGSELRQAAIDALFPEDSKHSNLSYTDEIVVMGESSRRLSADAYQIGGLASRRQRSSDSLSSGDNPYYRRDSTTSLSSRVSNEYKFAAIEHMNQISKTGRHD
ncbi:hypothetical protein HJC23_008242 [Cyclotella cryptica]|uniref:Uncharacterized protein n=1 Tax=Cyclotella cryptica TaxID=29204 RepID=A0ABD3Q614_9STRA|eukprot:CCRYP_008377-RA/>CCRYP_008377-RA protein AED:0.28 eAED:0.28 QI:0/-1/0/1/-1/1/1/0/211